MANEGSHRFYYPDHKHYSVGSLDQFDYPSQNPQEPQTVVHKTTRWDLTEHRIFIDVCEIVIVEGHRRSKCFSTTGWLRIYELFNSIAGQDWTISQLKNYWGKLRTDHKLLFELLKSTGIQYQSKIGRIIGPEHWWEAKIKRGFDLGTDSDKDDGSDKLPIDAEDTDSSDSPVTYRAYSSMNIFGNRSRDKRKSRHGKDKGKRKKYGAREISASLEQMVSVGTDLASIARSHQKDDMSIDDCVRELLSSGHVEEGSPLHMFALWFLHVKDNRNSYHATKIPFLWFKFIKYCFKRCSGLYFFCLFIFSVLM
ncbi:Hypothetical predicted protein [Olea europaea subsp. europaea]|uniref:Myb/SANT-like domain-containing protein n=1 Tax=Olea europaea subsp. europaea TaxID=158383 RepID=A0A8S0SLD1_OLEEU|nr:Hypothetical predicted protein [Olea europaea subsp. europaea]